MAVDAQLKLFPTTSDGAGLVVLNLLADEQRAVAEAGLLGPGGIGLHKAIADGFCGVAGVQPQSETVWRQATKYKVPRIAFVNKMDRTGANFENALNDMRNKLKAYAFPIMLPIGAEDQFKGCIDLVEMTALYWKDEAMGSDYTVEEIPADLKDAAVAAREKMIEELANSDDALLQRPNDSDIIIAAPPGLFRLHEYFNDAFIYAEDVAVVAGQVTTVPLGAFNLMTA
ncbi:MAG: hypothetical protein HC853_03375, partial [Anaerolineae bacterium]|nr:hypothetical protein [Anaerolineae bacterium]